MAWEEVHERLAAITITVNGGIFAGPKVKLTEQS